MFSSSSCGKYDCCRLNLLRACAFSFCQKESQSRSTSFPGKESICHCFWQSFVWPPSLPSPSALVCHLPTPPLACPLPYNVSAISPPCLSLNLFKAANQTFQLYSFSFHTKPMEFNFSSRSGSNLSLRVF